MKITDLPSVTGRSRFATSNLRTLALVLAFVACSDEPVPAQRTVQENSKSKVQEVTIAVSCKDLPDSAAQLQFEKPRECSVTISPWTILVSKGPNNPKEVRWTSDLPFEIRFNNRHFGENKTAILANKVAIYI